MDIDRLTDSASKAVAAFERRTGEAATAKIDRDIARALSVAHETLGTGLRVHSASRSADISSAALDAAAGPTRAAAPGSITHSALTRAASGVGSGLDEAHRALALCPPIGAVEAALAGTSLSSAAHSGLFAAADAARLSGAFEDASRGLGVASPLSGIDMAFTGLASSAAVRAASGGIQDRIADILSGKDIAGGARRPWDGLVTFDDIVTPGRPVAPALPAPPAERRDGFAPVVAQASAITLPDRKPAAYGGPTAVGVSATADLGRLVRAARKRLKLNQQGFADLAGVGRRFVSELEAGKPSLEFGKVLACCAAAGVDLVAHERTRS